MNNPINPKKVIALNDALKAAGLLEKDFVEKFVRGSGSGGQKINKTSSAVFLKHEPSGIEVKVQKSRSREANRFFARRLLLERYQAEILGTKTKAEKLREKKKKQKKRRSRRRQEAATAESPKETIAPESD